MEWNEYVSLLKRYLETKEPTRMFQCVKCTYNVGKGCSHGCHYCNVTNIFIPKLQKNPKVWRYRDGSAVKLFKDRLENPDYKKSGVGLIFIWYMGDWMCNAVPDEWILAILYIVRKDQQNEFLSCTKNPARYLELAEKYGWEIYPENLWFGTTIETNLPIANQFTNAPSVYERFIAMTKVAEQREKVFLSIEPKMDCEPSNFLKWIEQMKIKICEIGADNYHMTQLPEPPAWKAQKMLDGLFQTVPLVIVKKGFERLLQNHKP
ncbi:MAG: DUF5131 family protein [Candidatus Bathycorpusculaceae bacterium]